MEDPVAACEKAGVTLPESEFLTVHTVFVLFCFFTFMLFLFLSSKLKIEKVSSEV